MKENMIDGATLKEGIVAAASMLEARKQRLNDLNVFPVPDGPEIKINKPLRTASPPLQCDGTWYQAALPKAPHAHCP